MGTPAYDLTFTVNLEGVFYENRHSMTVGGKDEEFSVEDLLAFAKENNIRDAKIIIEEVASAFTHFYELAMQCHVNDYWASRIEEYISHLVPEQYAEGMTHYLPTSISPYKTQGGLLVTSFKLHETKCHDFQLSAEINGVFYTYMARRKSSLAREIIERGRAKMSEENIKKIIEEYFVPLANKNVND